MLSLERSWEVGLKVHLLRFEQTSLCVYTYVYYTYIVAQYTDLASGLRNSSTATHDRHYMLTKTADKSNHDSLHSGMSKYLHPMRPTVPKVPTVSLKADVQGSPDYLRSRV